MFDSNLLMLPRMRAIMAALVILALLQAGLIMAWATGLTQALCALWEGQGMQAASSGLLLFAICFAVLQVVRFAQETMLDRYSLQSASQLRDDLLHHVFSEEDLLARRLGAGHVATLANDGIDEVQTYVRIIPPKIVAMMAVSLPLLVYAFVIDWVSGLILAIMFPVIIFFMIILGRQARERADRQYEAFTRLTNRFMDTLRGMKVLKAFRAQDREAQRVYESSESLRTATVSTLRTATLSGAVLDLCATFGVAAVAIMLAFRLMDGSLVLYTGLLALIIAPEYFSPIRSFASDYHASLDGKNALRAVFEALEPTRTKDEEVVPASEVSSEITPQVEFSHVSYTYDDNEETGVYDISFSASGAQLIGIVGKSGSGKTTLASLFAGFIQPTSGSIRTNKGWELQVRYIPQQPYIFRMSLLDNLRFYKPDASRQQVQDVVESVGLQTLVHELPGGLDTLVGEGNRGLSGGEAHRVALARILLDTNAKVLVFDEPTAHLDVETERDLKEAMLTAMQGKLVLFATHRLHWMQNMDRIIRLSEGVVQEDEVA